MHVGAVPVVPATSSSSMPEGPLGHFWARNEIPAAHVTGKESMVVWLMSSQGWCLPRILEQSSQEWSRASNSLSGEALEPKRLEVGESRKLQYSQVQMRVSRPL